MTLLPILLTGGIHLDGFMDTSDALASYGDRVKKAGDFKDPHTGAFAIIGLGLYLLLYAGAVLSLWSRCVAAAGGAYAGTRLQRLFGGGISKGEKGRACR